MTGSKESLSRLKARARELRESDAFAQSRSSLVGNSMSVEDISVKLEADRRKSRKLYVAFGVVCTLMVLVSLPLPYDPLEHQGILFTPQELFDSLSLFFRMNIVPLFDPTAANLVPSMRVEFEQTHQLGLYYQVGMRVALTFLTVLCGWMLAASGLLFQSSFRNPLAAPTMLGVSDGVSLGYVVFLLLGYVSMRDNPAVFFACTYGCGVVAVVFVLFAGRFISGAKTYNVMDMLLIGTVVAQMLGGIVTFVTNYGMDSDTWYAYYLLLQSIDMATEPMTYLIVGIIALVCTAVLFLLRFRLNVVAFSDEEGRMLGVRPAALRWLALACGSLMQLASIVSIGQVAMLSLAVPFLVRYIFPAEFRSQLIGNFLVGVPLLLLCQLVAHFIVVSYQPMPVGTVVGLVVMPFFVWMMALQKRGWE